MTPHTHSHTYRPAGFFIRGVAFCLDLLVISAFIGLLRGLTGLNLSSLPLAGVSLMALGLLASLYFLLMTRYFSQTLGKMIMGIRVIQTDGLPPGWFTLLFREVIGRHVSQLGGLHLGYLWGAFHPRKQTWHDLISDTYVIHDPRTEAVREIRIPLELPSELTLESEPQPEAMHQPAKEMTHPDVSCSNMIQRGHEGKGVESDDPSGQCIQSVSGCQR